MKKKRKARARKQPSGAAKNSPTEKKEGISVIIPVLNEAENLRKLLPIIKKQKGVNVDIIVADSKSKDGSARIARKLGARVSKGGLPPVGRNNGARMAKYERILFLDADVLFEDDYLIRCIEAMKRRSLEVAAVTSRPLTDRLSEKFVFASWDFWMWLTQSFYPHAGGYCMFSSKRVQRKIKGFDERIRLGEDSNYALRSSRVAKFGLIGVPIGLSTRRLRKDGAFRVMWQVFKCGVRRIFVGEDIGDNFHYEFNEYSKKGRKAGQLPAKRI